MRKALIVGIDYYPHLGSLSGCVNDAYSVRAALERHADGTLNFATPNLMTGTGEGDLVSKQQLKEGVRELFADDSEIALFYFAGHGYLEDTGGFLCTSENSSGDDGLALLEVMALANTSRAKNKIIILDSCHSGAAGAKSAAAANVEIADGMTILTASTADQYAMEGPEGTSGVFTNLLVDALNGAAANLVGDITPGSVYAHIDQSLGPWAQRPVFRTNVKTFVSLRKSESPIPLVDLQAITKLFPRPDYDFSLDPSYEPERTPEQRDDGSLPPPNAANNAKFTVLQKYARVNLARPVDAPHMWHAAMQSKSCELTVLGQHYWALVHKGLI